MIKQPDSEINGVINVLETSISSVHDQETLEELRVQLWVLKHKIIDEDTIYDCNFKPNVEAAAYRVFDWLNGYSNIQKKELIVL